MPKISVIVPVYKVEEYLPFCVDSILNQTFTDFELILVDDGSPDNCGKICDEYAEKDSRVRVIHQENGGLSAARNSGIDIAEGEYLTFIDSDDAVTEDYLEALLNAAEENNADISMCRFKEFEDGTTPSLRAENEDTSVRLLNGREACIEIYESKLPINSFCKLYKSSVFGNARFPEGRLHEDQAVIPLVFYNAATVAVINRVIYLYRVRSASITHELFSLRRYDDVWAIDGCISFFESKNETEIVKAARDRRERLLCSYAIYAKRDGIEPPEEYKRGTVEALLYLRRNVSDNKYSYCLAQVYPSLQRAHEYVKRIERVFKWN